MQITRDFFIEIYDNSTAFLKDYLLLPGYCLPTRATCIPRLHFEDSFEEILRSHGQETYFCIWVQTV